MIKFHASQPRVCDSRGCVFDSLLMLLKVSLWGGDAHDVALDPDSWMELYREARRHKIVGVLYPVVSSLPCSARVPQALISRWREDADLIRNRNLQIARVADKQAAAWTRRGIRAVEIKGRTAAALYPDPLLRVCGDIDWWFPTEDGWKAALVASRENGCYLERDSDGDVHYLLGNVVVEHHRHGLEAEGSEGMLLLLNKHILHHAMGAGVGLRHVCDLALALDQLDYDREAYLALLDAHGLLRWNSVVEELAVALKTGDRHSLNDRHASALLDLILQDGDFGMGRPRRFAGMASRALFFLRIAPRTFIIHWYRLARGRLVRSVTMFPQ